jgi:serine phosphatase RsbU (regulator of sigma subunit)/PAS domain-containing protein/anti-sigma regulatory factor (Ser/Thr protein kinase)
MSSRSWPSSGTPGSSAAGGGLLATDRSQCVTAWSATAQALLGYAPEEAIGQRLDSVVDAPCPPWPPHLEPRGWSGEIGFRARQGHVLSLAVHAYPLAVDGERSPWTVVALAGAPAPSEDGFDAALLRWLFGTSPIPLSVHTTDLRCVRQSAAMNRLAGPPREAGGGTAPAHALVDPEGVSWERRLREVVASGTGVRRRDVFGTVPTAPDRESVFLGTASPLTDPTGRTIGLCSMLWDVTEYRRARERLTLLNEASTSIGTTLDVRTTARELTDILCPGLTDWVNVDLLESVLQGGEPGPFTGSVALYRAAHKSVRTDTPERLREPGVVDLFPADSPPIRCMATGRSMLLPASGPEIQAWLAADPPRAARFQEYGYHSVIVVPIVARGTVLGGTLLLRSRQAAFTEDDLLLTEDLVSRAAVCLDNARRYDRERGTALTLQRSLLPRTPRPRTAVETAGRYLPADSETGVGGDWYDVIPLSGTRVALVVGDVVGHGIHAAATMGRLRTAVRTLADVDLPPDELLTHLDDVLTGLEAEDRDPDGTGDLWATCAYAVYDPISRTCVLASAGHPTPVVVLPDGTAATPEVSTGPPLGVGGLPFENSELTLPEGSLLALYTDGLLALRQDDPGEGQEDLHGALRVTGEPLDELCDAVLGRLLPGRPADDATLLLARTRALDAEQVAVLGIPQQDSFVGEARSWAADRLETWGLADLAFVTELVVSELVTNAIRYGRPPLQLRLIHDRTLICEVADSSTTAPHMRRARSFDEGGRGLLLVAQLTQRWGTRHSRVGKTIWCEQRPEPSDDEARRSC